MTNSIEEYHEDYHDDEGFEREFSDKVLELIARAIGESFTGTQIISLLKEEGFEEIEYPKTKWRILFDLFTEIESGKHKPKHKSGLRAPYDERKIKDIIVAFLLPLNHNANEEKAEALQQQVIKILKYTNLVLVHKGNKLYITTEEQLQEAIWEENSQLSNEVYEEEERDKRIKDGLIQKDIEKIIANKHTIEEIISIHQSYSDILETFCDNPKKPTNEINSAYLYLKELLQRKIKSLGLSAHRIDLYVPFQFGLYSAEKEWEDNFFKLKEKRAGQISWDKMRPYLNHAHGQITQIYGLSERGADLSDDEKRLGKINELISGHRIEKSKPELEQISKMEILLKHEKDTPKQKIKLSDYEITFDNETAQLKVGNFLTANFPPHKNEHYLLRKVFSFRKNEAVDWQDIYEEISGTESKTIDKDEVERQKKSIKDTVRAVNNRVKEVCNTDSDLLSWGIKNVTRAN